MRHDDELLFRRGNDVFAARSVGRNLNRFPHQFANTLEEQRSHRTDGQHGIGKAPVKDECFKSAVQGGDFGQMDPRYRSTL